MHRAGCVRALVYLEGPVSNDVTVEHYVRHDLKYELTPRPKPSSDPKNENCISLKVPIDKLLQEWCILISDLKNAFRDDPFGEHISKVWIKRIQSDGALEPIVYLISKCEYIQVKRALVVRMLFLYYNARICLPPRWRYTSEEERLEAHELKLRTARFHVLSAYKTLQELCLKKQTTGKKNAYEYLRKLGQEYPVLKEIVDSETDVTGATNNEDVNLALIEWEDESDSE
jgi:hypothetical protein